MTFQIAINSLENVPSPEAIERVMLSCPAPGVVRRGPERHAFIFPEWEVVPTKTMVKCTGTGREVEELADKLRTHEKQNVGIDWDWEPSQTV